MTVPEIVSQLAGYALTRPQQAGAVIVPLLGVLVHYQRTGSLPIGRLPWRYGRKIWRELADQYFGKPRPKGVPGLVADAPPERVAEVLRERHYESADNFSYEYQGEVYNLRRPSGVETHPETGEQIAMENHPRLFKTKSGQTLILAHHEASRFEETGTHLDGKRLSWTEGQEITAVDLQAAQISYEEIASEREAGIEL